MIRLFIFSAVLALVSLNVFAQQTKKKIDANAYNEWSTIRTSGISANGKLIYYELSFLEDDSRLLFLDKGNSKLKMFSRGKRTTLAGNDRFLVFMIDPQYDSIRKLKLNDTPKDKLPKDSLGVYDIEKDTLYLFSDVKSFQISEFGSTICILNHKDKRPECPKEDSKKKKKKKKTPACLRSATSGTTLTLFDPISNNKSTIDCVTSYLLDKSGQQLLYVQSNKGKTTDSLSLFFMNISDKKQTLLVSNFYGISSLTFDETGSQVVFYGSDDTNKVKNYSLYYFKTSDLELTKLVDSTTAGMPQGHTVSENGRLSFNHSGDKIVLGTNKINRNEPKDTLLESEKAKVDVWGSNDSRIQPLQLSELNRDKNSSYKAIYDLKRKVFTQLENKLIKTVSFNYYSNSKYAIGISNEEYLREMSWAYPWKDDYYLVDIETGESKLLLKGQAFRTSLSPSGNYLAFYNGIDSSWNVMNTQTMSQTKLINSSKDIFATDMNGMPSVAEDEGFYGWTKHNDKEYFLVQSINTVWLLSTENSDNHIEIKYEKEGRVSYFRNDYDSLYTNISNNYFIYTNSESKNQSITQVDSEAFTLREVLKTEHKIISIDKAKNADTVIFRRMNFYHYPDLEFADSKFTNTEQISDCNPQQKDYNWGTVEQVSWTSYDGIKLDGLLYKPEDFDPSKKYPMIVYYYEKYSDDIHNYYSPRPTASIVYATEYVSNGYIIFIPDIVYKEGYPAKSAYNCIMSGTDYLIRSNNWIDSTRMGLQGQSWGGYQTAQLITMTNRFKAAMAGAPVSNMFSAYGGIRWTSGLSRQFQYEKTQSRIGYTIWERPDLYMANSPVFGLPKVETPLLIMSNDGDGAVPWYQGIEMYMGLRRLDKPVWLLNYNGDEHNLMNHANRKDLSIRMRQFFDYYLLGAQMPNWMSDGVPATDKGKNYGFGYSNQ